MGTIKVVVFDCDGVIFDSKNANKAYYNAILNYFDFPGMSDEQTKFVHAHTVDESLAYLAKSTNLFKAFQNYRSRLSYASFIELMEIEPTLFSVLGMLRSRFKTAVATNRTDTIGQILKYYEIAHLFDFVVCSSDVESPKPDPAMLNKVIKHFNISSSEAIYIGDSKLDELASNSANITFVAYKNRSLNASAHINSLSMLGTVVSMYSS